VIEKITLRVDLTRMRVESTHMHVVKKTITTKKKLCTRLVPVDLRFMCKMMSIKKFFDVVS
jgi:hypothetical protein